jgi:putative IMPACT (imprinted ancient) family translation regulator
MDAYSQSVKAALDLKNLKKRVQTFSLRVDVPYEFNDVLLSQLKKDSVQVIETLYTATVLHSLEIEQSVYDRVKHLLLEYQSQGKLKIKGSFPE